MAPFVVWAERTARSDCHPIPVSHFSPAETKGHFLGVSGRQKRLLARAGNWLRQNGAELRHIHRVSTNSGKLSSNINRLVVQERLELRTRAQNTIFYSLLSDTYEDRSQTETVLHDWLRVPRNPGLKRYGRMPPSAEGSWYFIRYGRCGSVAMPAGYTNSQPSLSVCLVTNPIGPRVSFFAYRDEGTIPGCVWAGEASLGTCRKLAPPEWRGTAPHSPCIHDFRKIIQ